MTGKRHKLIISCGQAGSRCERTTYRSREKILVHFLVHFVGAAFETHQDFTRRLGAGGNHGSADDFHSRGIIDQRPFLRPIPILTATRDEYLPRCRNSHAPRFEFVRARKINRPTRAGPQPPARDITPIMPRVLGTERGGQRPSFKHALKPRAGAIGCDHASVHLRPGGG